MNTPQFKNLTFKNEPEFEAWLNENTSFIIEFEDQGQDLLKIHIHSSGEILHCSSKPYQTIFNGRFVDFFTDESGKDGYGIVPEAGKTDYIVFTFPVKEIKKVK